MIDEQVAKVVCQLCLGCEDAGTVTRTRVHWAQCVKCKAMFHNNCVGLKKKLDNWTCAMCVAGEKSVQGASGGTGSIGAPTGTVPKPNVIPTGAVPKPNVMDPVKTKSQVITDVQQSVQEDPLLQMESAALEVEVERARKLLEERRAQEQERLKREKLVTQLREMERELHELAMRDAEAKRREAEAQAEAKKRAEEIETIRRATDLQLKSAENANDAQNLVNGRQSEIPVGNQRENNGPGYSDLANQRTPDPRDDMNSSQHMSSFVEQQAYLINRQFLSELPEFTGMSEDWPVWFAQFQSSTIEGGFSSAQNMTRLRKCLKGRALDAVRGALSLPDNVDSVIAILKARFGNMDVIVHAKMQMLETVQPPCDKKPETVVAFFEFLLNMKATLSNANARAYLRAPQTLDTIVRKLSPGAQTAWMIHRAGNPNYNLDNFLNWYEPTYRSAAFRLESQQTARKQRVNYHEVTSDQKPENKKGCLFCKKDNHKITDCRRFHDKNLKSRWDFVKKERLCFRCLLGKHMIKNCDSKSSCGIDDCKKDHHKLLHKMESTKEEKVVVRNMPDKVETVSHQRGTEKTYFRVVPVRLSSGNDVVETWAFLDQGSGPTLLSEDLKRKLKLNGPYSHLCLKWTNGTTTTINSEVVTVNIAGVNEKNRFALSNVYVVPEENLDLPGPEFDINELKQRYAHLKDVHIPDIPMHRVGILIGLEHAKLTIPYQIREGAWNEPIATKTRIGWSIYGKTRGGNSSVVNYVCSVSEYVEPDESLEELFRSFQTTESFGVTPPVKELRSMEDEKSLEIFDRTLKLSNGRYEVGLLWKHVNPKLPDNRKMAMKRLICFEQRLLKDPAIKEAVIAKVRDNIEKGYMVETNEREIAQFEGPKWFLPMFGVQNPNKPGKLRLVYDAAAQCDGVALNDYLMKGPDNLTPLFGVLLRFRNGKVGICGDIAEMFHRVKLIERDQFVQLVLWRDVNPNVPPKIFKLVVMSFGATCSPSAAQHVKNTNAVRYQDKWPRAVKAILDHHYVDDYLDCANSVDEALELARQVIEIHGSGGFHIRNWISNCPEVVRELSPLDTKQQQEVVNLDMVKENKTEKVLGMRWNIKEDCFVYHIDFSRVQPEILNHSRKPTKREVARVVMSLFDPLGILATVVMPAKILIQDLWRCVVKWDQTIPDEIDSAWKNWLEALKLVKEVKVPRWLSPLLEQSEDRQLHLFSDASELAFCAVAYLRITGNGKVDTPLVCAKTRVAPPKPLSIPRLELQGAVLASRLAATIKREIGFPLNKVFFWTDSQTVLGWLRSSHRKYHPFVAHRVGEILDSTSLSQWHWVPGKENVADEGTKWDGIPQVTARWLEGPAFLAHPSEKWPVEKIRVTTTVEEEKTVQFHAPQSRIILKYDVIKAERFSNWKRILRTTAFVLRYIQNLRMKTQDKSDGKKVEIVSDVKKAILNCRELDGGELDSAQNLLFKKIQSECYNKEVCDLTKKGVVEKKSPIYNLTPIIDNDGIVRVKTRLDAAPALVESSMKRPILIDGKHPITSLIIQSTHRRFHHCNREAVTNDLRQYLWIPKIRSYVNKVITRCTLCAFHRAKPAIPQMAPLPPQRMAPYEPPFSKTGLDYAGPFEVVVGRRREKRWIALFTCLTMRAIHLEVANTLDTSSCVMVIRNFMNRRGVPTEFFSDNGTNLKSSEKELRLLLTAVDKEKMVAESQPLVPGSHNIRWHFITPSASHFGGVWERMVRLVKTSLYMVLKSRAPHDEIFRSAVVEVEATVNSRPLHYTSTGDPCEPAISPNSLLRLNPNVEPLPENHENIKSKKQWIMVQEIAQIFWQKWLQQYLPTIATRSKWFTESEPLKIGSLVLVVDENLKRGEWQRGIVLTTHTSYDGKVRSATVKTAKGTYRRPVAKLAVIDPKVMGLDHNL